MSVINKLSEKGFDKVYGARPLRRLITIEIEDMLSEKFLSGELNKEKYIIDYKNEKYSVREKSLVWKRVIYFCKNIAFLFNINYNVFNIFMECIYG